jgi:DNA-directed RNA polymerase subunit RPC12/RpoP
MFKDRTLKCSDCGADFVFTAGEQEFYAEKGFDNEPKRCQECRSKRKNQKKNNNGARPFARKQR